MKIKVGKQYGEGLMKEGLEWINTTEMAQLLTKDI